MSDLPSREGSLSDNAKSILHVSVILLMLVCTLATCGFVVYNSQQINDRILRLATQTINASDHSTVTRFEGRALDTIDNQASVLPFRRAIEERLSERDNRLTQIEAEQVKQMGINWRIERALNNLERRSGLPLSHVATGSTGSAGSVGDTETKTEKP